MSHETTARRAWLAVFSGICVWILIIVALTLMPNIGAIGVFTVDDWLQGVLPTVMFRFVDFSMAFVVGLIAWIVLHRSGERRWQSAALLGAVAHFVVPAIYATLYVWAMLQSFDLRAFNGGLVRMVATMAIGAAVGGVMWRVAYRRSQVPSAAEVFS